VNKYQIAFLPEAAAELVALDKTVAKRVWKKIEWLAEHFEHLTPEPFVGELKGLFKLRIGAYRVVYSCNQEKRVIVVHLVGHRRDVYKSP